MKVLVTGGAGFIGSHLVRRLIEDHHEVSVIDDLSTGSPSILKNLKIAHFLEKEDSLSSLKSIEWRPEVIFHLGMPSSTPLYTHPAVVGKCIREAGFLLSFAEECKAKFILASTSNLYNGYPPPWFEEMGPPEIMTLYTETRYYIERLVQWYGLNTSVSYTILRFFSVYGQGERQKGKLANIVSQMIWAKLEARPFEVYGQGLQTRDSIYVEDVVEALVKSIEAGDALILNVGTGISQSFTQLALLLGIKLIYLGAGSVPSKYVYHQEADISLTKGVLGWEPRVSLEEGIKCCLSFYQQEMKKSPLPK